MKSGFTKCGQFFY